MAEKVCAPDSSRVLAQNHHRLSAATRPFLRLGDRLLPSSLLPPHPLPVVTFLSPSPGAETRGGGEPQHPTPRGPCIPGAE